MCFYFSIHPQECRLIFFFVRFECVTSVPQRVGKGQRICTLEASVNVFFPADPIRTSRKRLLAADAGCQHGTARGLSARQEPVAGAANIFRAAQCLRGGRLLKCAAVPSHFPCNNTSTGGKTRAAVWGKASEMKNELSVRVQKCRQVRRLRFKDRPRSRFKDASVRQPRRLWSRRWDALNTMRPSFILMIWLSGNELSSQFCARFACWALYQSILCERVGGRIFIGKTAARIHSNNRSLIHMTTPHICAS